MKNENEVINDIFGKQKEVFTRKELIQSMTVFANQFKWIKTTCGQNLEFDDLDYEVLRQQAIFIEKSRGIAMAVWVSKNGKKTVAPVAKLLLDAEGVRSETVNYKDKNFLNLKRSNIELISFQKSHFKQKKPKTANGIAPTSNYKGVSWSKFAKKWCAYIKVDFKKIHLGYFSDEEDAVRAYNESAIEYFGKDYSGLNILPSDVK